MEEISISSHPQRISDLVALKEKGVRVTCQTSFAVIPVDFRHRRNPYQAHVFLVYFSGMTDGEPYTFRKCYARGCSHNLCPHVSQAVLIANHYLQRDYRLLEKSGFGGRSPLIYLGGYAGQVRRVSRGTSSQSDDRGLPPTGPRRK